VGLGDDFARTTAPALATSPGAFAPISPVGDTAIDRALSEIARGVDLQRRASLASILVGANGKASPETDTLAALQNALASKTHNASTPRCPGTNTAILWACTHVATMTLVFGTALSATELSSFFDGS